MKSIEGQRNQLFDFLRILFATFVVFSHAFEIPYGTRTHELFGRLTHSGMTFGEFGVDGFFLLSGFLITQSWERDPELLNFLRKRVLRIVPGFLVASVLSVLVVGLLAPAEPHFFRHLGLRYVASLLLLAYPFTPPVFPGDYYHVTNGALWTIVYEFRCYLLVALLGVTTLLRRRYPWLVLTLVFFILLVYSPRLEGYSWHEYRMFFGELPQDCRLTWIFLVGGCYYLLRDRIRFTPWIAVLAAGLFLCVDIFRPDYLEMAFVISGSYFLFYLGKASLHWRIAHKKFPDISYGVYLYGWPVLGLVLWYTHYAQWPLFLLSIPICFILGWLSWHFVERPMLSLKRRPTAPLPPA